MYFFLAFFWYKYYISILQIQICIILFDVPPLKHTKYNNLEYRVWVQCSTAHNCYLQSMIALRYTSVNRDLSYLMQRYCSMPS